MAITQNTFTGNGSNLGAFSFTFKWLEPTDIKVTVGGVLKTAGTHYNLQSLNYTTKDGGQVLFTAGNAPANNAAIRIYRDTDDSALSATFYSGSAIRAQDLNDDFTQNLYLTQEITNNSINTDGSSSMAGNLNMGGFQIKNLAEPTASNDAVTKDYVDAFTGNTGIPGHTRWRQLASAGQTVFSGTGEYGGVLAYSPVREQVYLNGALQQRNADYIADNGTSIVFNVALQLNDVVDVVCTNNLVSGTVSNAANINYSGQFTGQTTRTVAAKLADGVSVKDYGAIGDGVTDDMPYFLAMASALGYIVVHKGTFALNVASSTPTIDVPIYFGEGGGITVPTGSSVTFRNRIEASPKQQIFYGAGTVYFLNDNALGIGEDSKHSYAAWWGIFPVGQVNTIQTALFNKALAAYTAQTREGIFELDSGSYRIDGTVTIPRGVWFKGASTRRTIIDLIGSGYSALQSGGSAVWVTGIQFEQPPAAVAYFDGTQIDLLHDTAKVEDVIVWNAKVGIRLGPAANLSTIEDVRGVYGAQPVGGYPSDSTTILVQSDRNLISNVQVANTSYGPSAIVRFDASLGSVTASTIDNIVTTEDSILVDIQASSTHTVSETTISNIVKSSGAVLLPVIRMVTTSTSASIRNIAISNVVAPQFASYVLDATQGSSSGKIEAISISSVSANYSTSSGGTKLANLVRTAGTFNNVTFGDAISVGNFTQPIDVTGTITRLNVPNYLLPTLTIANDAVAQLRPYTLGGCLLVKNNGNGGGFPNIASSGSILFDVGGSPAISKVYGGANFIALTVGTVPTGTTGTAPNVSVSATGSGIIYIENRSGGSIEVTHSYL